MSNYQTEPAVRPRSTRRLRRGAMYAVLAAALAAPALLFVGPAQALDPTGVGPTDPAQRSFPAYYTDDAGVSLQMCDDGTAACLLARPRDLAPPEGEALYWAATGDLTAPGIEVSVEFALEAAWLDGSQVVFDRLRIRGHVDAAGTYTLTHPYGTTTVVAEDPAEQRNVNLTEDIGCEPPPGGRCNFREATTNAGAHITDWLTSVSAPPGYLGRGEIATAATLGGVPQSMSFAGPAGLATTDQFAVLGKRANPRAVSLPRIVDFGNANRRQRERVRLLNIGTQPLTLNRVVLRGSPTLRRFATPNACGAGDTLQVGQRCTVGIRYVPDGRRRSTARLRITRDAGAARVVQIRARTAATLVAPGRVRFAPRRAGTSSVTSRVVVRNNGGAALRIRGIALRGPNAGSFERRSGAPRVCARGLRLPVGGQCGIYVGFEPVGFGTKRARFVVRSNALGGAGTIALFGRAR